MSIAFITALQSLRARFDVLETPDMRPTLHPWPQGPSPEAQAHDEKRAQTIDETNRLSNAAGMLLKQNRELAKQAGISEKALDAKFPGPCWYAAVQELTGGTNNTPWGKESALAIDLLLAKLSAIKPPEQLPSGVHRVTVYRADKPPYETTSDELPESRVIVPLDLNNPRQIGIRGPTLNQLADQIAKLPQPKRFSRIVQLAEEGHIKHEEISTLDRLVSEKESAEKASMVEQNTPQQSKTDAQNQSAEDRPTRDILLAVEIIGFLAATCYILATWSEHSEAPWMMYVIVPGYVFSSQYVIYGFFRWCRWNKSSAGLAAIFSGIACGAPFIIAYIANSGDIMPILHVERSARFLPAILLTGFACLGWYWALSLLSPKASTTTTRPYSTVPSSAPSITRPPVNRPTTAPGPDTRSQLQILKSLPPSIDSLYYAEFGDGPMAELTQWVDISDRGEKMVDLAKSFLREKEPIQVTLENLHIGRDFLPSAKKRLRLYFCGDLTFTFIEDVDSVSLSAIREKLKRKISHENPGLTFRAKTNIGQWHTGGIFTELDFCESNLAIDRERGAHIPILEGHLMRGAIEIVS